MARFSFSERLVVRAISNSDRQSAEVKVTSSATFSFSANPAFISPPIFRKSNYNSKRWAVTHNIWFLQGRSWFCICICHLCLKTNVKDKAWIGYSHAIVGGAHPWWWKVYQSHQGQSNTNQYNLDQEAQAQNRQPIPVSSNSWNNLFVGHLNQNQWKI